MNILYDTYLTGLVTVRHASVHGFLVDRVFNFLTIFTQIIYNSYNMRVYTFYVQQPM